MVARTSWPIEVVDINVVIRARCDPDSFHSNFKVCAASWVGELCKRQFLVSFIRREKRLFAYRDDFLGLVRSLAVCFLEVEGATTIGSARKNNGQTNAMVVTKVKRGDLPATRHQKPSQITIHLIIDKDNVGCLVQDGDCDSYDANHEKSDEEDKVHLARVVTSLRLEERWSLFYYFVALKGD